MLHQTSQCSEKYCQETAYTVAGKLPVFVSVVFPWNVQISGYCYSGDSLLLRWSVSTDSGTQLNQTVNTTVVGENSTKKIWGHSGAVLELYTMELQGKLRKTGKQVGVHTHIILPFNSAVIPD